MRFGYIAPSATGRSGGRRGALRQSTARWLHVENGCSVPGSFAAVRVRVEQRDDGSWWWELPDVYRSAWTGRWFPARGWCARCHVPAMPGDWSLEGICRPERLAALRALLPGASLPDDVREWFPKGGADASRAAAACVRFCAVVDECRQHALENREEHGVWGGTTAADRWRIWREAAA